MLTISSLKSTNGVDAAELIQEALGSGPWQMEFNEEGEIKAVLWSDIFRRMIGYRSEKDFPNELNSFFDLLHQEDREKVISLYWNSIKDYTGQTNYDIEYRLCTRNRGYRWFHAAGAVARRNDGSPISIVGYFFDIDEKKKTEDSLSEAHQAISEQLRILKSLANMYYSMHLIDLKTNSFEEYASSAALEPLLADKKQGAIKLMKHTMENVVLPEYVNNATKFTDLTTIARRMKGLKSLSSEFVGIHVGWFIASFITIDTDQEGYPSVLLFTTQVIDESKKREEILFIRSMTDDMTGFYNRRAYENELTYYRENKLDSDLVFISMDINRLKHVNDNLGHAAGDEMIRGFAEIIRLIRDKYDLEGKIYRIGGDEFAIIGKIDPEQYAKAKNDFDNMTAKWKGYKNNTISVSCGIAFNSQNNFTNIDDMAKYADKMMYLDKNSFYERMNIERRN